jgi:putative ABC transport system substrate-binding protein
VGPPVVKQRFLFAILSILLLSAPLTVEGQQAGKVWRIAYLSSADEHDPNDTAFDDAAKKLGYVEGQNLVMQRSYLGKRSVGVDEVMRDSVRFKPDVIVTWAIQWSAAAKRATSTIPVVFVSVRAPVERGLVGSLAKPGMNVTGLSTLPLDAKMFEVARELIPVLSRVAVLRSADDPPGVTEAQEMAARSLGVKLVPIPFSSNKDASNLLAIVGRSKAQVLVAPGTVLQHAHRKEIIQLAAKTRLPAVYGFREAVDEGGLISYGTDLKELSRRAAHFVDRILKGAKPADLPVEQPTKFELVINMRTARALGLTMPPSLVLQADHVIE